MFTGLVEGIGQVVQLTERAPARLLVIQHPLLTETRLGDSIALNGCCLTAIDISPTGAVAFEAGPETLARTNLGELRVGDSVNLERALAANGRLGGHLVQGHIDGTGQIAARQLAGDWETVWFEVGAWTRYLVPKGSVAIDGVSLTVVAVTATQFSVALIPHTLNHTTLGQKAVGDTVNLETDILGKYIVQYLGQLDLAALIQSQVSGSKD